MAESGSAETADSAMLLPAEELEWSEEELDTHEHTTKLGDSLSLQNGPLSTSEAECTNGLIPVLCPVKEVVPTSELALPSHLIEDHILTSEDCAPRLDIADTPTTEECVPKINVAGVPTIEGCIPRLDTAENHVLTALDRVPRLDVAEDHVLTTQDRVPRLEVADIPTTKDCVPSLNAAEGLVPDCLLKFDLAECQKCLPTPDEHPTPMSEVLSIPKPLCNGTFPLVTPQCEKHGELPSLIEHSPSSENPSLSLQDATLLSREDSQTSTDDDEHEYYLKPEEMFTPLTPAPGDTQVSTFQYRHFRVFQRKRLGRGSYGMVCRAMCDELPCAAKLMHPIFFRDGDPGTPNMLLRFVQECHVLSAVRHPCIVQYLGVCRDSQTRMPILLMELMDESLTQFLDRSKGPVPYHLQVDICRDVVLALSYLHTNGIIHRDLSSNNVLMVAGSRAKVTDFGMSKLIDVNPRMTPLTECPGTQVYMSPEALRANPHYTAKLDVFSAGVLMIQIMTRQFPSPSDAKRTTEDPKYSGGPIEVPVPERERRQSDIDKVDPAHPLLPCALTCLADRECQRPTAFELCQQMAELRTIPRYDESKLESREKQATFGSLETTLERKEAEIRRCQKLVEQHSDAIAELRGEKEESFAAKDREIEELKRQLDKANQRFLELSRASPLNSLTAPSCDSNLERFSPIPPDGARPDEPWDDTQLSLTAPHSDLWYHGRINRFTACYRLDRAEEPGSYLIRKSSSEEGHYVLSFRDQEGRIHHFIIKCKEGRYNIGGNIWFSSLRHLIGYYSKYSSVVEKHSERLDHPIPPPETVPLPLDDAEQ